MAKVTSKLQLTIPKAVADQYRIRSGDEVEIVPSGSFIRMNPASRRREDLTVAERVKRFRRILREYRNRQRIDAKARRARARVEGLRGWSREDLYTRGSPR
jgi:AbrB family looped-hinge helix DNA binding protein